MLSALDRIEKISKAHRRMRYPFETGAVAAKFTRAVAVVNAPCAQKTCITSSSRWVSSLAVVGRFIKQTLFRLKFGMSILVCQTYP
jgi:hypothetical protein